MRASRRAPLAARCLLLTVLLSGCVVLSNSARATSLVLGRTRGSSLAATSTEAPAKLQERVDEGIVEEGAGEDAEGTTLPPVNATTKSPLTGVPQNDYKYDPNLPRELNGFNLSDYPFFNAVPEDIDFKCDGLHDGFYASVPHKCQLYHHCLFGTRYDFLCANYTAFDQRTFICHFVSEVDCVNSPKFYGRNEALYKQDSTTTSSTTTTSTTPSPSQDNGGGGGRGRGGGGGGRRRRPSRRRPVDYYDEYDDYDYYQEEPPPRRPAGGRRRQRPENRRPSGPAKDDFDIDPPPRPKAPTTEEPPLPTKPNRAVFEKPRTPPRIRPPVPVNEREKFIRPGEDLEPQPRSNKPQSRPSEDEYDDEYEEPVPPRKNRKPAPARVEDEEYAEEEDFRRTPPQGANGRPLRRNRPSRRRPSRYDDYDDESDYRDEPRRKRPSRRPDDDYDDFDEPPRRKRPSRTQDDVSSAGSYRTRSKVRPQYAEEYEDEAPRPRKGQRKSSTTTTSTTTTTTTERPSQRRKTTSTTPYPDDDYYYEDEIEHEEVKPVSTSTTKPVANQAKTETISEPVTQEVITKRTPFVPRKSTPPPDALGTKPSMKFAQFKNTDDTEESGYVFKIDDYVKPTTRPPFVPLNSKSQKTTQTEESVPEAPAVKEVGTGRQTSSFTRNKSGLATPAQPEEEDYPSAPARPAEKDILPPRPAAFTPRQKTTTSIPTEPTAEEDYPSEPAAKLPVKDALPPRPAAFTPRSKLTTAIPSQHPTSDDDYEDPFKTLSRVPARVSANKPLPPVSAATKDDSRTLPRSQYKIVSPTASAPDTTGDDARGANPPFVSRFKPSAPDFTSPASEEPVNFSRVKIGTPPSDIASKSPSAPPPRSRLSTSFLPRGLSPVGGARSRLTAAAAPTSLPDIDNEEDDAINDALHPTGSDASSTISSQRFPSFTSRTRSSQQVRGGQDAIPARYYTEQTTAASQTKFTRIPSTYDDYSDIPSQSGYRTQVAVPFPTTALDTFARQPSAPSSFRAAAAIRPSQNFRESPPRNERRPVAAASVQYSIQQEPASSSWGGRDYFYTY